VRAILGPLLYASITVGAATAQTHVETFSIQFDGRERLYKVLEPESYCPGRPALVILHGGGQSASKVFEETAPQNAWVRLAEREGLLVIAPNGWNVALERGDTDQQSWNDLRDAIGRPISEEDDAGFIAEVVRVETRARGIDPRSLFVAGSSNGGMMTYRMLIEYPGLFAGGAGVIANLPENDVPDPEVARPIVIINGDADPLMPWEGGAVGFGNGAPVRSAIDTLAYWRRLAGADTTPGVIELLPDVAPSDGTRVLRAEFFADPTGPPPVVLYRVINGGHSLPLLADDPQTPLPSSFGVRSLDANGAELAWGFFERFLPEPGPLTDFDTPTGSDAFDLIEFLRRLDNNERAADLNCDRLFDAADVEAFLRAAGGPD